MKILFEEQDLINAVAVQAAIEYHGGEFEGCNPELVSVALHYNEKNGTHATVTRPFHRVLHFDNERIFTAMSQYLELYHSFNPHVLEHETTYFHEENRYEGVSLVQP